MKRGKTISFYIDNTVYKELSKESRQQKKSISYILNELIKKEFVKQWV